MATTETQKLDGIISSRRNLIMMLGGTALAGAAVLGNAAKAEAQSTLTDNDILNFALNLEYLEAEYYTLATSGQTIDQVTVGIGAGTAKGPGGSVTTKPGGPAACQVPFVTLNIQDYAGEIASEERRHVQFLRNALGANAVAQPNIDLYNSFNAAAAAAGIGPAFDPFKDEVSFLLGSYIFEDVGVTAYHGAAPLIKDTSILGAAVGIHAVEAYHAGLVRTTLWGLDQADTSKGIAAIANKISALRATLDGTGNDDIGLTTMADALNGSSATYTASTIVNADAATSRGFSRTTTQVLSIVYASASATPGGFFPNGLNGTIK
jgi:hypothetical protein